VRLARVLALVAVVLLVALIATRAPWWLRALLLFPVVLVATIAFFEARSSVCVVAAAQGVYEDDGRAKTPMNPNEIPAIRRVALSLTGKSILLAAAATIAASLTALGR
jgi:hypothetical protein